MQSNVTDDDDNTVLSAAFERRQVKKEKEKEKEEGKASAPLRYEAVIPAYLPSYPDNSFVKREENLQNLEREGILAFKSAVNLRDIFYFSEVH